MGLFSTIVNGFNNVNTWLDDARDLLNGSLESNEYKELKAQVTDNTVYMDSGRFVSQDEVLKRFHLGNEFQSESHNDVFAPGFDSGDHLHPSEKAYDAMAGAVPAELLQQKKG